MEKRNQSSKRKCGVRKDRVLLLVLFIGWTLLAGMFIQKTFVPSMELFFSRLDSAHAQTEIEGPYAYKAQDEAYNAYVNCTSELINSEDDIISFYAKQNCLVKLALFSSALIPFGLIYWFIYTLIQEEKRERKAKRSKRTHSTKPQKSRTKAF